MIPAVASVVADLCALGWTAGPPTSPGLYWLAFASHGMTVPITIRSRCLGRDADGVVTSSIDPGAPIAHLRNAPPLPCPAWYLGVGLLLVQPDGRVGGDGR